jgi:transposase-like protein
MVDHNHEPIAGEASQTMIVRDACPECGSQYFKKNGHIYTGKQNHQCKACGRQFVVHADNRAIAEDQRALAERLLLGVWEQPNTKPG